MSFLDKFFTPKSVSKNTVSVETSDTNGIEVGFDPLSIQVPEHAMKEMSEKTETWVQGHVRKLPHKMGSMAMGVTEGSELRRTQTNNETSNDDGSNTILGYGFASSSALTERGFSEGSKIRNIDDLNMSLELLTCEYQSHIQSKLDSLESKSNAHMQNWSRMAGVSEAHDGSMKKVLEQIHEQMQKFHTELNKIEEGKGMVQGIHIAYKRGYVQAIELAGHIQYYDAKAGQ